MAAKRRKASKTSKTVAKRAKKHSGKRRGGSPRTPTQAKKTSLGTGRTKAKAHRRSHLALLKAAFAFSDTTRDIVVEIIAKITGQSAAAVVDQPLRDLVVCDPSLRAALAAAVDTQWPDLDPRFTSADVECSDTAGSLTMRIIRRLP